jgi:hypothetical protein
MRELTGICLSYQLATEIKKGIFNTIGNREERWRREYMERVGHQTDPAGLSII